MPSRPRSAPQAGVEIVQIAEVRGIELAEELIAEGAVPALPLPLALS